MLDTEFIVPIVLTIAIMLLVAFPIHEFAHAWAAWRLGDGTAKLFGRLTLNPVAHFDPVGGTLLAISFLVSGGNFAFGWAKPTPVNPSNLRGGRRGEALVAAAGPMSNLVLAAAAAIPLRFLLGEPALMGDLGVVLQTLGFFVLINVILMIFNLFPVPPLDGSKVLFAFLPPRLSWQWRPVLEQYGFVLLLVLFFFPPGASIGGRILEPILDAVLSLLVGF
ncbi:MAG TPA: site-2 protease family protein [Candidatus Limnocylindrales bacterium]|nr:site-2 protease family protein [Candidatus Limnocylindrales bacterium]